MFFVFCPPAWALNNWGGPVSHHGPGPLLDLREVGRDDHGQTQHREGDGQREAHDEDGQEAQQVAPRADHALVLGHIGVQADAERRKVERAHDEVAHVLARGGDDQAHEEELHVLDAVERPPLAVGLLGHDRRDEARQAPRALHHDAQPRVGLVPVARRPHDGVEPREPHDQRGAVLIDRVVSGRVGAAAPQGVEDHAVDQEAVRDDVERSQEVVGAGVGDGAHHEDHAQVQPQEAARSEHAFHEMTVREGRGPLSEAACEADVCGVLRRAVFQKREAGV